MELEGGEIPNQHVLKASWCREEPLELGTRKTRVQSFLTLSWWGLAELIPLPICLQNGNIA